MKMMPKDDLIKLLKDYILYKIIDLDDLERIMEEFGDDWYIIDGEWKLCKKNETREIWLNKNDGRS